MIKILDWVTCIASSVTGECHTLIARMGSTFGTYRYDIRNIHRYKVICLKEGGKRLVSSVRNSLVSTDNSA